MKYGGMDDIEFLESCRKVSKVSLFTDIDRKILGFYANPDIIDDSIKSLFVDGLEKVLIDSQKGPIIFNRTSNILCYPYSAWSGMDRPATTSPPDSPSSDALLADYIAEMKIKMNLARSHEVMIFLEYQNYGAFPK